MRTTVLLACSFGLTFPLSAADPVDNPLVGDRRLSAWRKALASEDDDVRANAAYRLHRLGEKASPLRVELLAALGTKTAWIPSALAGLGPDFLPEIVAKLKADDPVVRHEAAQTLGHMQAAARPALPALFEMLADDEDALARHWAGYAIRDIGPDPERAVPAFVARLSDDDLQVKTMAVHVLGRLGEEAKSALPAMLKALAAEKDHVFVHYSMDAIREFDPLVPRRCRWLSRS